MFGILNGASMGSMSDGSGLMGEVCVPFLFRRRMRELFHGDRCYVGIVGDSDLVDDGIQILSG